MHKQIIYFDMDGVLVDIHSEILKKYGKEGELRIGDILDEDPSVFMDAKPIEGAVEAFKHLSTLFDVYILSTAPWSNPESWMIKRLWVEKYLGQEAYKRLILSHHKNLLKGDYLIDDRCVNGVEKFEGVHVQYGTEPYSNWEKVVEFFNTISKS